MWAQLIKARAKSGKEEEIRNLPQEIQGMTGGGQMPMLQVFSCSNQKDPQEFYTFVVFESEEAARENERSSQQAAIGQHMSELFEGPPEFVDLNVDYHLSR